MSRNRLALIIVLAHCCPLFAATYWISPKGQLSGTGTETNPFASVDAALKRIGGGHTLIFKPADPMFLDAAKGAFYLKEGSPAIGKGSGEYAPECNFFNRPLPEGKTPDLGCFAYDPSLLSPQFRRDWYCQWPFLFRVRPDDTLPDFWKLPE